MATAAFAPAAQGDPAATARDPQGQVPRRAQEGQAGTGDLAAAGQDRVVMAGTAGGREAMGTQALVHSAAPR